MSEPTVFYKIDKSNPDYVKYVENTMSAIYEHFKQSKICVVDCKDTTSGQVLPVICAKLDNGIIPLASLFAFTEDVSSTLEVCNA